MKTSREQLKFLLKEILIEILTEGLGSVKMGTPMPEHRSHVGRQKMAPASRMESQLTNGRIPSEALREAVRTESGGNPILADILADTAMTTLPTQLSHGDSMGRSGEGGPSLSRASQQEQFTGSVEEVFGASAMDQGDGSTHWADLAFMPAKKTA